MEFQESLTFWLILGLAAGFAVIGKAADVVVRGARVVGAKLGLSTFVLGLILGILTSTPELAVGIHSSLKGIAGVSFGNLMGGITVLLGLIVGLNVVLNRGVDMAETI